MNRDRLTLAFGIVLVVAAVAFSLRHNLTRKDAAPTPAETPAAVQPAEPSAPADTPAEAPVTPPAEESANAAARPRTRNSPAPAAPTAPAPATETAVTLQVESDVPGASVFLDREYAGTTPLTVRNLAVGSKRLNVTAEGHEGYVETLSLVEGTNRVNVEFRKVRLNASMPVVHKHRMGSCQGTLAASVNGLSYETSDKEDAFTLAFSDVDQFDIDYMKKNLRVRRRGGKTWNFTNDNADALFVFHRDVTKAREKLGQ